ncbi:MAG: hypothetical protein HQ538_06230 [Parcubacteria group bacterium]|nr:hypothetical protein [Parcubacteria group bacterium]
MSETLKKPEKPITKWLILGIVVIIVAIIASSVTYIIVKSDNKDEEETINIEEKTENNVIEEEDNITEDIVENDLEDVDEESSTESSQIELVDGSFLSDDSQVYKNEEKSIQFNYPNGWKIAKEEKTGPYEGLNEDDALYEGLFINFKNQNNSEAYVTLENPNSDKGLEGNTEEKTDSYEIDNYSVLVSTYKASQDFYESMNLDIPNTKLVIASLNSNTDDYSQSYAFTLRAPQEDFDEYSKFIIEAISTFQAI